MSVLDELRTETGALREFLQALAEVYSAGADVTSLAREELRLAWLLAEGVVQANEAFIAFADPSMEMAEEFLDITRETRESLRQTARKVAELRRFDADDLRPS